MLFPRMFGAMRFPAALTRVRLRRAAATMAPRLPALMMVAPSPVFPVFVVRKFLLTFGGVGVGGFLLFLLVLLDELFDRVKV